MKTVFELMGQGQLSQYSD